ncbi:putative secreted protein [Corynebacterium diphtheriae PW8]|nr:putative secreted protein [Corynebacterium diphtheriae PW8]
MQLGQRQRGVFAVVVPLLCMLVPQIGHAGRFLRPVIRIAVAGSNTTGWQ